MGFTEQLLYDHSVQEHSETFTEVACPICCTMPNVEPGNLFLNRLVIFKNYLLIFFF